MIPGPWIAPSKIGPWSGTRVKGERYTRQQLDVLKRERPTWTSFQDRQVTLKTDVPIGHQPRPEDVIVVQCPIIAWTKDRTRVLIVAPAGDKLWVPAAPNK